MNDPTLTVRVSRGGLHLSGEGYEQHFSGISGIVLMRREADLLILPGAACAGRRVFDQA